MLQAKISYGIGDSVNDVPLLDASDVSFTFWTSPENVQSHAAHLVERIEEALAYAAESLEEIQ